jgi:Tfp pilus assembly protein PilN
MAAQKQKPINLLIQQDFEHSASGRILSWLLSSGRAIVIITELIVIIAFISRFWLDKTLTDLSEANASKKTQIEASLPFETDFKSVQKRLVISKQLDSQKANAANLIQTVVQVLPQDIILSEISVNEGKVIVEGESLSEGSIASLINSLNKSNKIKDTNLTNIALENKAQQLIAFRITGELIVGGGK